MFKVKKQVKKMDCREIGILISIYHDGELKGKRLETLENHLSKCHHCAKEYEFLSVLSNDIKASPELEIPRNFTASIMDKVKARPLTRRRFALSNSVIYTTVFFFFLVFGLVLNTSWITNDTETGNETEYFPDLMAQSQEMTTVPVSDTLFEIFEDEGGGNEK
jgi:predicted anti-sigma-YlaC factor YlaD